MMQKISGALNPNSGAAEDYAIMKYESIRKQSNDVLYISRNTDFTYEQVSLIKGHIFYNKHVLNRKYPDRFDASYEMAQSWERLSRKTGKGIQPHDILLLYHELTELTYMANGCSQQEAHELANMKYNYGKESNNYYKSLGF